MTLQLVNFLDSNVNRITHMYQRNNFSIPLYIAVHVCSVIMSHVYIPRPPHHQCSLTQYTLLVLKETVQLRKEILKNGENRSVFYKVEHLQSVHRHLLLLIVHVHVHLCACACMCMCAWAWHVCACMCAKLMLVVSTWLCWSWGFCSLYARIYRLSHKRSR